MIKLVTGGYSVGKAWDHKGRTELVQIFISHDDYAIRSLQFLYAESGKLVLSDPPDGSSIGNKFSMVTLQYPEEFLTSLKGSWDYGKLTSIEFGTNLGKHGPFGQAYKGGKYFDFQMGNHRSFGGFHGTARISVLDGSVLESIGVYVKLVASLSNLNSDPRLKS